MPQVKEIIEESTLACLETELSPANPRTVCSDWAPRAKAPSKYPGVMAAAAATTVQRMIVCTKSSFGLKMENIYKITISLPWQTL